MKLDKIFLKASNIKSSILDLPASKSLTNRILLIASLCSDQTIINNMLFSDDTLVMIDALKKLGVKIKLNKTLKQCHIIGSHNKFPVKIADLYIGNAGTAIRPLTACLAFNDGKYKIHGTPRMHERPISDLVNSLKSIGAKIEYLQNPDYPPLLIKQSYVKSNKIIIKGNISSQFLTSLLIASPIISKENNLNIKVEGDLISKPYADITLNLIKLFNLKIKRQKYNSFQINAGQAYKSPKVIKVEGDASSATYFLAAASICGKRIKVKGIGAKSIQGDIKFVEILKKMGANIIINDDYIISNSKKQLIAIDEDLNHIPDAAMTVAMLCLYANGTSILRNIGSWRVKETDRLSAMTKELSKLGAQITEGKDFLKIKPPKIMLDASIDTYEDHRMAMCFSLASLNSKFLKGSNITINDPKCVAKTFPNYFEVFKSILI